MAKNDLLCSAVITSDPVPPTEGEGFRAVPKLVRLTCTYERLSVHSLLDAAESSDEPIKCIPAKIRPRTVHIADATSLSSPGVASVSTLPHVTDSPFTNRGWCWTNTRIECSTDAGRTW